MPFLGWRTMSCTRCGRRFSRMQGDVITSFDLLCDSCRLRAAADAVSKAARWLWGKVVR